MSSTGWSVSLQVNLIAAVKLSTILITGTAFYEPHAFAANSYQVAHGSTVTIDEHNECRRVKNNHASGRDIFVPTKEDFEWLSFINNPPADVEVLNCTNCVADSVSFTASGTFEMPADCDTVVIKAWGGGGGGGNLRAPWNVQRSRSTFGYS